MTWRIFWLGTILLCARWGISQDLSNVRTRTILPGESSLVFYPEFVYPPSIKVYDSKHQLDSSAFFFVASEQRLVLNGVVNDTLWVSFRVFPYDLSPVKKYDTSLVVNQFASDREKFLFQVNKQQQDIFGGDGIRKSGSISRGITFGNSQDLGVNSSLNLELSGELGDNLKLLASLSDDNIPIQADGNTNTLREFDQVFIQVYNDKLKLSAGDFWLYRPKGYFMNYKKRAQGLSLQFNNPIDSLRSWSTEVSGALSKGKFNRQIIQGVEGNQGPYRLQGAENETFILILAGTERVYIDGRLLERGQQFDYVIDYNTAELTFTAQQLITKDSRIVVEFQYSDQNYARSLFQINTKYSGPKLDFWFNAYSEQDAKNQSIQQNLSAQQKQVLANAGDSLQLARVSSIDSIGFLPNQNLYWLTDSLGYDSVLVFTVNQDSAIYQASFQYVGNNQGDYILQSYNGLGKVFKWVAPSGGIPQGDYVAARLLIAPKQKQLVAIGVNYKLSEKVNWETEIAYSKNDLNTFSRLDAADDPGVAIRSKITGNKKLGKDSLSFWTWKPSLEIESLDKNFQPIEQYRAVEFDRDWNTRNKGFRGNQLATTVGNDWINRKYGNINLDFQQFLIGDDFQGYRGQTSGKWNQKGFQSFWIGSYMNSRAESNNEFVRHKVNLSQRMGFLKLTFTDDHERNTFFQERDSLRKTSYQFYDYNIGLETQDTFKIKTRVFFRERYDWLSDSVRLSPAAKAQTVGGEVKFNQWKNQKLELSTSYRSLKILNNQLINQTPENTLLGRLNYDFNALKRALSWDTYYEIGSGLEQRREFLYLQVNDGQGIYTWIDYNGDGVKDLNEFEVAQFVDQASYIRVFVQSNSYTKSFSNEFNQSVFWRFERLWGNREGVLKVLSRFSNQTRLRMQRKTSNFLGVQSFNPFQSNIADTNLISTNTNFRNTLYFNRTSSVFALDWSYQLTQAKTLLASGFDSRALQFNELNARWNITKRLSIETRAEFGEKVALVDYTVARNYAIEYQEFEPSFYYQPTTYFRLGLITRYAEKENLPEYGGEQLYLSEAGMDLKFNQAEKGSFLGNFKVLRMDFAGNSNSAVGFEMLEALKPGINYTWQLGYQRMLSKTLQLSVQYNGRKSEANPTIHSAGMEVRAFF